MVERITRTVETKDGGLDAIDGIMLFSIECLWMEACGGLIYIVAINGISCQESHSISEEAGS